ncbi:hypothetical protein B0H14DRAFT_2778981 [Mycena olivaceomarginata]|nr:hypothetical protein B0H14DRAFT_2778981 [Mycena olivaceomarginata]
MVLSVTPAQYFNKKRGLANGIVYAGGGIGGTVTSFPIDAIIESQVGPAWAFVPLASSPLQSGFLLPC